MKNQQKLFALKIWADGRIAVRPVANRKYRVRQTMPDDNCDDDGEIVELLDTDGNEAAQVLLPLLKHIDKKAVNSEASFVEALNELLTVALKTGLRLGAIQKEKELRKKRA